MPSSARISNIRRLLHLVVFAILLAGCASKPSWQKPQAIQPNETVLGANMSIKMPSEAGWMLVNTNPLEIFLADPFDKYTNLHLILQLWNVDEKPTEDELLKRVTESYQTMLEESRAQQAQTPEKPTQTLLQEFTSQIDSERHGKMGQPCVRTVSQWLVPLPEGASNHPFFRDNVGLACQHPHYENLIIMADFSYQGDQQYYNMLESHAQQFFDGIIPINHKLKQSKTSNIPSWFLIPGLFF